jgi:hypothetical protein
MRAHVLSGNLITNTIIVSELEANMIDAEIGGAIGDEYNATTNTFTPSEGKITQAEQRERMLRDALLSETDKWVAISAEAGQPLATDKAAYRQALRDLPEQEGWPFNITWPEKPE